MTRALPEWIGKTDDAPIPPRVRLRVFERCGGCCSLTGHKIRPGDAWQIDHVLALVNGGENRETNLALVSADAHRLKSKSDVAIKSKTARIRMKHLGLAPKKRGLSKPAGTRYDWARGRYVREG